MNELAYWVWPAEFDDRLAARPDLLEAAARFASLAHYGNWYRLEVSPDTVTCCVLGPLTPARAVLWVSGVGADRPLQVKSSPRLLDPAPWTAPEHPLGVQLSAAARLVGAHTLLAERALVGPCSGAAYYRVTVRVDTEPPAQALLEARAR